MERVTKSKPRQQELTQSHDVLKDEQALSNPQRLNSLGQVFCICFTKWEQSLEQSYTLAAGPLWDWSFCLFFFFLEMWFICLSSHLVGFFCSSRALSRVSVLLQLQRGVVGSWHVSWLFSSVDATVLCTCKEVWYHERNDKMKAGFSWSLVWKERLIIN